MHIVKRIVKSVINPIIYYWGVEIRRRAAAGLSQNMSDVLTKVSRLGFNPKTVIDVGVGHGTFPLYEAFPDAFHLLIEPLREFEESLTSILNKYRGIYVIAAASSRSAKVTFNVHMDHLYGSSLLKETMGAVTDGKERIVNAVTLDEVFENENLTGPCLIKVDVQGAELDVLEGAREALRETELVILEVSMFQFMKRSPQFYDVVDYMKKNGFVVYDMYGGVVRPLDGALGQIDVAFVKENGPFRRNHSFATMAQWENIAGK